MQLARVLLDLGCCPLRLSIDIWNGLARRPSIAINSRLANRSSLHASTIINQRINSELTRACVLERLDDGVEIRA